MWIIITLAVLIVVLWILGSIKGHPHQPPKPGKPVLQRMEQNMATARIKAFVNIPPPGASDVATRTLKIGITGTTGPVQVNGADVSDGGSADVPVLSAQVTVEADKGANVALTLTDTDEDGNASVPSDTLNVVFADTFPPPKPEALTVDHEEQA